MFGWEMEVGKQILGGVVQQLCRLRETGLEAPDDLVQLGHRRCVIGLGEHHPHQGPDRALGVARDERQQVAHEMHPAALPRSLLVHNGVSGRVHQCKRSGERYGGDVGIKVPIVKSL